MMIAISRILNLRRHIRQIGHSIATRSPACGVKQVSQPTVPSAERKGAAADAMTPAAYSHLAKACTTLPRQVEALQARGAQPSIASVDDFVYDKDKTNELKRSRTLALGTRSVCNLMNIVVRVPAEYRLKANLRSFFQHPTSPPCNAWELLKLAGMEVRLGHLLLVLPRQAPYDVDLDLESSRTDLSPELLFRLLKKTSYKQPDLAFVCCFLPPHYYSVVDEIICRLPTHPARLKPDLIPGYIDAQVEAHGGLGRPSKQKQRNKVIAQCGLGALNELIRQLQKYSGEVDGANKRLFLVELIGALGRAAYDAAETLIVAYGDEDNDDVCHAMVRALSRIGGDAITSHPENIRMIYGRLIDLLKNQKLDVAAYYLAVVSAAGSPGQAYVQKLGHALPENKIIPEDGSCPQRDDVVVPDSFVEAVIQAREMYKDQPMPNA